ncbi:unnamed protein product [Cochlearia groenlandica]
MENYQDFTKHSRIILDDSNYGFWKSRIKFVIKGIDILAWRVVQEKWEDPTTETEDEKVTIKPEDSGPKTNSKEQNSTLEL